MQPVTQASESTDSKQYMVASIAHTDPDLPALQADARHRQVLPRLPVGQEVAVGGPQHHHHRRPSLRP